MPYSLPFGINLIGFLPALLWPCSLLPQDFYMCCSFYWEALPPSHHPVSSHSFSALESLLWPLWDGQSLLPLALPAICLGHILLAQTVKNLLATQETRVWSLGREDLLEKGMVIHYSILARRIPWTEKSGGLQFLESQRLRHDWATNTSLHAHSLLWSTQSKALA